MATDSFTAAGTHSWVCPVGVLSVVVKVWGGGGGGGGATGNPAAGGGAAGGSYAEKAVTVTPGTTYTVVVAATKAGTTGAGAQGNSSTWEATVVVAVGGPGGVNASVNSTNGAGGTGTTTGCVGDTVVAGSNGSAGDFTPATAGGQGGQGASSGGAGGIAPADSSVGPAGTAAGGGGAGGKANTTTDRAGGTGAIGRVDVVYTFDPVMDTNPLPQDFFTGIVTLGSLVGRTPDGGDDANRAVGTWTRPNGTSGTIGIGAVTGIHGAVRPTGSQTEADYVVAGVEYPADHGSVTIGQFTALTSNNGWLAAILHHSVSNHSCYILYLFTSSGIAYLDLYRWDNGGPSLIGESIPYGAGAGSPLPPTGTPLTVGLYRQGPNLVATLNGIFAYSVEDTTYTGGLPGFSIGNSGITAQNVVATAWEVTDETPPGITALVTAPQAVYAEDGFDGPEGNIDRRILDGGGSDCLANGHWEQVVVDILDPQMLVASAGVLRFNSAEIITIPAGQWRKALVHDIPNQGADGAVEAIFQLNQDPFTTNFTAWVSLPLRYTMDESQGYEFLMNVSATGVEYMIFKAGSIHTPSSPGMLSYLARWQILDGSLESPLPLNVDQVLRFCAFGNQLFGFHNGVLVAYAEDDTWLEGGLPGLCMYDGQRSLLLDVHEGLTLSVHRWRYISDKAGAPGCDGPGGGGGGGGETPAFVHPMGQGGWRPVPTPSPTSVTRVQPYGHGAPRATHLAGVYAEGAWRVPIPPDPTNGGEYNGDPGNSVPDPGCGQVTVPTVALDPIGERIFYCAELPLEGETDPFDTSYWAFGEWTPNHLAICQARGLRLITTQGGYTKFQTGGVYDPNKMDAWIASRAFLEPALYPYFTAGTLYGIQFIDDYRSTARWPTASGVPISGAEVDRIAGVWKSYFPWMRTIVRDTVIKATDHAPGEDFSNVDVFLSAYVSRWGLITPWIAENISRATALGGKHILWAMNCVNFRGLGLPMSAADVLEFGGELASQSYSDGMGIWKYDPWLNGPGIIDALATVRNIMVATP